MYKNSFNIPTSLRILIIIQLCIAFYCGIWLLGYPFMGGHFKTYSELILMESVMGVSSSLERIDPEKARLLESKITRNRERFNDLADFQKKWLENEVLEKKLALNAPFLVKIKQLFRLLMEIPTLEILWILMGIALPILLLFRNQAAIVWIWILPLVALGYIINNQINGKDPLTLKLFPQEKIIQQDEKEIKTAWDNYLIKHWAQDEKTAEAGEFFFNLKRIEYLDRGLSRIFWEKKSPLVAAGYLIWNLFFAWRIAMGIGKSFFEQKSLQFQQEIHKKQQS